MSEEILNHPLISQRYFFPRREPVADPWWIDCGDARLACHYREVDRQASTIVHFHGNGEIVNDYIGVLPEIFANFGCNTLLVEYRGYGGSTGRPELGRILDDVAKILEALPADPEKTILFGRSVGSLPALEAASLWPHVGGLIIESGIADVLERLLLRIEPEEMGVNLAVLQQAVGRRLDHRRKIASCRAPLLILHTARDGLVEMSHAERLYAWSGSDSKQIEIFSRGDHNTIMAVNAEAYFGLIGSFVADLSGNQAVGR